MIPTPCENCGRRHLGCHGKCAEYKAYREDIKQAREKEHRDKEFGGYRCEVFAKQERYKRNHERSK